MRPREKGNAARRRSRGHRRLTVALAIASAAVVALVATGAVTHSGARTPKHVRRVVAPQPAPPGPIPGYLLIADRGNNRMLLVDSAKHVFWSYPKPGVAPAMPFHFDDDTFFGPRADRIISNQEDQQTIQVVSVPGGRVLWRYGHVNVKSSARGDLNTPDDAYLLRNGVVTVADAYNCRVLFISQQHRILRQYGTTGRCAHDPPRLLGSINGATPLPDGGTLVSEITGSWIDDIGPDGKLRWDVQAPVSYPSDPQLLAPNRILLADYARPGAAIVMSPTGRVLWRYGPASGPGELDHPSLAMRIGPGLIAINDDYRHRVVIVSMRTKRIVWQYGHTDVAGRGPGFLNTPDGMDLLPTATARSSPTLRPLLLRRPAAARAPAPRSGPRLAYTMPYRLPAPVERTVAVAAAGGVVVAGGLDAAGQSTNGVFRLDPRTGSLRQLGRLPQPFHDGAGAVLGGRVVVFGGGTGQSSSAVQAFDLASRTGTVIGRLPRPLSDLAAAAVGGAVYLVGGWDGRTENATIYRTTDGVHFAVAGRLPVGLRYPAVAVAAGKVVIAGGLGPRGTESSVYAFDPATGRTSTIARLPRPLAHAAAVTFAGRVYVIGAPGATTAIDASTGTTKSIPGPPAIADAAAVTIDGRALLIGGSRAGTTVSSVVEVRPVAP